MSSFLDCLSPLGMEDGRIEDTQLNSTTSLNNQSQASRARLNHDEGYGGWCPYQKEYGNRRGPQYIEVRLETLFRIKGIAMQARANGSEKVDRYRIQYQTSKGLWKWYLDEQTKIDKVSNDLVFENFMLHFKVFLSIVWQCLKG